MGSNKLRSPFGTTNFVKLPRVHNRTHKVSCKKAISVPAHSICQLDLQVNSKTNNTCPRTYYEGIFTPNLNFIANSGIILQNNWCYAKGKSLSINCINISDSPCIIHRNKMIGQFEPFHVKPTTEVRINRISNSSTRTNKFERPCGPNGNKTGWENVKELHYRLHINDIPISDVEKLELKAVVNKYSHCFAKDSYDIGKCKTYEAEILLEPGSRPVWVPSRNIPYNLQKHMDAEIDKMEKSGIIGECLYSKWNLPVFLVPKKLGKYRFVCDSRMLNRVSQPDPYELPNINNLLDKLSETKYLSTLDLHQSYFQVGLHPDSQP